MNTATSVTVVPMQCKINNQMASPNEVLLNHLAPSLVAKSRVHITCIQYSNLVVHANGTQASPSGYSEAL